MPFPSNPMAGSGHVTATSTSSSLVDANLCHSVTGQALDVSTIVTTSFPFSPL